MQQSRLFVHDPLEGANISGVNGGDGSARRLVADYRSGEEFDDRLAIGSGPGSSGVERGSVCGVGEPLNRAPADQQLHQRKRPQLRREVYDGGAVVPCRQQSFGLREVARPDRLLQCLGH
jgi:hypothetical protein